MKIDTNKYHSIKFYRDVVWTSFKGINEISKNNLSYPYTAIAYKNDSITDIFIAYSHDITKVKYLKKYKELQYVQSKYYNPEFKIIMYQYKFFMHNGSSITFDCDNNFLSDSIKVNTIYNEKDSLFIHSNKLFALPKENCKLEDVLTFNIKVLRNVFREYGEEILQIENNSLYRVHDLSEQISYNRIIKKDEKFMVKKEMPYTSFFYFYNDDSLYESIP